MDWRWLMILLTAVYCRKVFASKEVTTQINTKKLIHYLPDRFLSMTIDPFTILAAGPLSSESMNMAKALSPGLVRIGGKGTNILKFGKEFMKDDNTITEIQWRSVNNFVKDAGLDMILSLNPTSRLNGGWDSSNSVDLIAFSEKEGFDVAWQFGYGNYTI
ncbi:hypothetical protein O3M35_012725 [Rhynocoris fuscipes]|uniref:Uncharacterized protein n=1 Tax=Rhynocoris fuscipes TaxID=488301 RepID=A0AAW1D0P6_9HEMI